MAMQYFLMKKMEKELAGRNRRIFRPGALVFLPSRILRILTWSPYTIGHFTVNRSPLQLDDEIFTYNVMHVKLKMMALSYHFLF